MAVQKTANKQILLFAALCLIILMAAGIINKFINESLSIGIIGGSDGPTVIYVGENDSQEEQNVADADIKDLVTDPEMIILINKEHELAKDYVPEDLTRISAFAPGRDDSARYMRKEAAEQLAVMFAAAEKEDLKIVITTAYRSYGLQKAIFDSNVAKKGSIEAANKTSAKPGQSEHQTGLATDLSTAGLNYEITYDFGTSKEGLWIAQHCWEYGFIIRYPSGREDSTGYTYEPWHIRYVGKDAASFITKQGQTLEEFIIELNQ